MLNYRPLILSMCLTILFVSACASDNAREDLQIQENLRLKTELRASLDREQQLQREVRSLNQDVDRLRQEVSDLKYALRSVEYSDNVVDAWEFFFDDDYDAVIVRQIKDGAFGHISPHDESGVTGRSTSCPKVNFDRSSEWPRSGLVFDGNRNGQGVEISQVPTISSAFERLKVGDRIISVSGRLVDTGNKEKAEKLISASFIMFGYVELTTIRGARTMTNLICHQR
ncbi:MAG: PDZ domain-containing protein [Maricaulaceae bacterium]